MRHLDLFSGIGGFAFAALQVWRDRYENIGFVEIDAYCQVLLKLRFPKARVYGDIKKLTFKNSKCELITGGFPCQPFSSIGKRQSTEDDRYLWPEMLRIIQEVQPRWIVAENVRGILTIEGGLVFEQVCVDLEKQGYEIQTFIIPAIAVNAPHRRDRIWIIANRNTLRLQEQRSEQQTDRFRQFNENITDTESWKSRQSSESERWQDIGRRDQKILDRPSRCFAWDREWTEAATKLCRMDDGFPARLDEFELSKSKHRIERLKALGNAIVPQIAIEIFRAIKASDI